MCLCDFSVLFVAECVSNLSNFVGIVSRLNLWSVYRTMGKNDVCGTQQCQVQPVGLNLMIDQ